jgi:AcrR family transcriptional regulator
VPRHPDPERKPQLVIEILDYLLDKPLASVSFRTIARALGFSTYTLVYHFGTRANLLSEVVAAASARVTGIEQRLQRNPGTLDVYFDGLVMSWQWTLDPRNRQLQRLEFEAALIEAVEPETHTFSRALYETWLRIGGESLVSLGLSEKDAALETRLLVDTFYGIQYDFVLNNDAPRATAAFDLAMVRHRERLELMVAESGYAEESEQPNQATEPARQTSLPN